MKVAVYVPGLGDHSLYGKSIVLFLELWRLFGVKTYFFEWGWGDSEDYQQKLARLLAKIDRLAKDGHQVSLVGVSAGASAALNAFSERPAVHKVVCICGKINNPQGIGDKVFQLNPSFKKSLEQLQKNLKKFNDSDRNKILSIHPAKDSVVPPKDTIIPGAHEMQVNSRGHVLSILYCVIFKCRTICKFITA